jgi:hypothetical protein
MSSHFTQTSRMLLVLAWATLVGIAPISADDKDRVPSPPPSQRFEGYLFIDADGHPLPFQSDEAIEEQLRTASVVSQSKIPVGVSRPKKMLLDADSHHFNAAFKNIDEEKKNVRDPTAAGRAKLYLQWRDSYTYDVAAYHVDRLLGLNRMPPTVIRTIKGNKGSLQIWVEGSITEAERREQSIAPPEIARFNQQRSTLQLFDNLVANRDSNLGNTLIDGNWRLWFIDCSRCFERYEDLLYPEMITHCDRAVWRALKQLDRGSAAKVLSPFLSPAEIDAIFARRDKLVDLIQARIDEWGEELVLFDQRPPTDTAPWIEE